MVAVRLLYVSELVVLAIVFHVVPLSIEDCQLRIVPVTPANVSVPLLELTQTVLLAEREPATVCGLTVMVTAFELTALQVPL